MKNNPIIYIFLNYIVAAVILIHTIANKLSLKVYLTNTLLILFCINVIYILIIFIISNLFVEEKESFELEIPQDEEELDQLKEILNTQDSIDDIRVPIEDNHIYEDNNYLDEQEESFKELY